MMDLNEIKKYLHHRYPFLYVDRMLELNDNYAKGLKNITANEQVLEGHFPFRAVFPGVLMVEAMAQVGGILLQHRLDSKENAALTSVDNAVFKSWVTPGDQLIIEAHAKRYRAGLFIFDGECSVDDKLVCKATIKIFIT